MPSGCAPNYTCRPTSRCVSSSGTAWSAMWWRPRCPTPQVSALTLAGGRRPPGPRGEGRGDLAASRHAQVRHPTSPGAGRDWWAPLAACTCPGVRRTPCLRSGSIQALVAISLPPLAPAAIRYLSARAAAIATPRRLGVASPRLHERRPPTPAGALPMACGRLASEQEFALRAPPQDGSCQGRFWARGAAKSAGHRRL